MLNELFQAAAAMRRRGVRLIEVHPAVEPMGQNRELLLVELDAKANPKGLKVLPGREAGLLLRVAHGSEGSSFPGFNLPLPLRAPKNKDEKYVSKLDALVKALQARGYSNSSITAAIGDIFAETSQAIFTDKQNDQFKRSVQELVGWMKTDFAESVPELVNFRRLLDVVSDAKLELPKFAESLASYIRSFQGGFGKAEWALFSEMLFGNLRLKSGAALGPGEYRRAKEKADEKLNMPIFIELADGDKRAPPVSDARIARALNQHLLKLNPLPYDRRSRKTLPAAFKRKKTNSQETSRAPDAYSGGECAIPDKYPEPKLEQLGSTRLFSNNTNEAGCFFRYGLGDSRTFVVSGETIKEISAAAFTLAGNDLALKVLGGSPSAGRTCRAIPGGREGKKDLLIAYLEEDPNAPDPYVDLFGVEAATHSEPDFSASTKSVLAALEGKVAANPNQRIQLFAVAAVDKANRQISLSRSFTVCEVMAAAKSWQASAANCPPVTLSFFDKDTKKPVPRERTVPSPLDIASVLNKVWASDSQSGLRSSFQRIINVSDAYEMFLQSCPAREGKARAALRILLDRMRIVFGAAGALKASHDFEILNEPARWQVLKAVALIGIFLDYLNQKKETFMNESVYQVGRLLALADSLHFHYCKWVRTSDENRKKKKVSAPSELIGNALFNAALDNPITALSRLAERIRPYKGWASTYCGEEDRKGRWLLRLMADCEHQLKADDIQQLPRMEDVHKAQLLLGYLADLPKSKDETPKTEE